MKYVKRTAFAIAVTVISWVIARILAEVGDLNSAMYQEPPHGNAE